MKNYSIHNNSFSVFSGDGTYSQFTGSSDFIFKDDTLIKKCDVIDERHNDLVFTDLSIDDLKKLEFTYADMIRTKGYKAFIEYLRNCEDSVFERLIADKSINEKTANFFRNRQLFETLDNNKKKDKLYRLNKKKVKKKLFSFFKLEESQKEMYFITITFPISVSDDNAYKYFNNWLTRLRTNGFIRNYLWVAERQKNLTIHFHMFVNQYFDVRAANDIMQNILIFQRDINGDEFSNDLMKYNGIDIAKGKDKFGKRTKHVINFAKCKDKALIQRYVTKYVTKNDVVYDRLVWHCSRCISALFTNSNGIFKDEMLQSVFKKSKPVFTISNDYFNCYIFKDEIITKNTKKMYELNNLISNMF